MPGDDGAGRLAKRGIANVWVKNWLAGHSAGTASQEPARRSMSHNSRISTPIGSSRLGAIAALKPPADSAFRRAVVSAIVAM
jgi:hypothetical protein